MMTTISDSFKPLLKDLDTEIQQSGLPYNSQYVQGIEYAKKIISKYLKDDWTVVDKNAHIDGTHHMSTYFLTIENDKGFRRTVIARFDCVDNCFEYYNSDQKVIGKCIALKEFCIPAPYEGDRCE